VDTKTFILGITPPAMAIAAELLNPVSSEVIRTQTSVTVARQLARRQNTGNSAQDDILYDTDVANIAEAIAGVSEGTAEISALIPTWISVTAGLSAVLVELASNLLTIAVVAIWIAFWAMLGIKFFSTVKYYETAYIARSSLPVLRNFTGAAIAHEVGQLWKLTVPLRAFSMA
jgi:hypothetical protein